MNLRSLIKTDVKFQVAGQCCRCSDVANFSVTAALGSVTMRFLQTLKICGVVNNHLVLFSMLVIYFKINILVYFCLVSVCFALLTTMRV